MKKIPFKINYYYLSICLISLITLYPILIFVKVTLEQVELGTKGLVTTDELNRILNVGIDEPKIFVPFIIGIFSWTSNTVLSLLFLYKKKIKPSFAYATLLLGGLGLHIFIWIFNTIKILINKKTGMKFKEIVRFGALGLLLLSLIGPFAITSFNKNHNSAFIGNPIQLSLNKKTPNLIEVFTDGFWRRAQTEKLAQDKNFEDFKIYDKYFAFGRSTYYSLPTMFGNFKDNNMFSLFDRKITTQDKYVKWNQTKGFAQTFKEHMTTKTPYFAQNSVINPVGLSNVAEYNANTAGTPSYLKKLMPNLNITNWAGAKEGLGFGIHNASPDINSYKWLNKNMQVSKTGKAARVYISDMITHPAYMSNKKGEFLLTQATKYDQWSLLRNTLSNLFAKLKSIKDGNTNAYDNSMIIVYGDHKDHSYVSNKKGAFARTEASESLMILKYPNQRKPAKQISDKSVWAPQLNRIINNFVANPTSQTLDDFIEKNPLYNATKKRWIMMNWSDKNGSHTGIMQVSYKQNSDTDTNAEFYTKIALEPDVASGLDFFKEPNKVMAALNGEVY